ncbi:hypothetical protein M408DRAFT_152118 [Serendipita vermifera MAFF 305830]|uniref:Uncharacterized protein n=1 Tax=Serendipita vermifera MAFF 305830 TaxID=933852 RepID=A0A0C3BME4_SERVB|nr:hypothetical protein M408DRAFT_152118 [Serendipita vermifera MAFF 305830]
MKSFCNPDNSDDTFHTEVGGKGLIAWFSQLAGWARPCLIINHMVQATKWIKTRIFRCYTNLRGFP